MLRLSPLWIALACATATHSTAIAAPGIWRCGNSYSDIPCDGGQQIGPHAPPSAEERRLRDENTRRDQAAAEHMQRERLELEARPRHSLVIGPQAGEAPSASPPAGALKTEKKKKSARPKKPEDFTATYTDPAAAPAGKKKNRPKD